MYAVPVAIHLGNLIAHDGSNAPTLNRRIQAMREGYYGLRRFWGSRRFGNKHNIMIFKAVIEGALFSGFEARYLNPQEVHRLEVERLWVLRKVAGKEGIMVAADGTRRQHSNDNIRWLFRLDSARNFLFRRRLLWLQGMTMQKTIWGAP